MAEKKAADQKDIASGSKSRTSRVGAQNNAIFARLFASLDAEHRKLKELEARRSQVIEEMKNLRTLLFAENQKLRQTVAPMPGSSPLPIPATSASPVVKNSSGKSSVTIAEPPTQRPKASTSQVLKKKGNRRGLMVPTRKSKQRIALDNISNTREDMLDEIDASAGSNLRTLELRRSNLADRADVDEVLVSLPALFTLWNPNLQTTSDSNDSKALEVLHNADQDASFYLPSADSLFKDILGADSTPIELNLAEIVENEHDAD
ncbi:uncharacterized protein LOC6551268 [Drosophila erecta]|uniref:Uncharacterized protein n=1 Tax=Drosophila erecta TaxID=7220 RepID=B3NXK9_DROER|nr:uncharacterized protein LOC6551268 [Drosophila erecta]EDV47310.1 uncharacterized protein Dere_GG19558 [Drosophila erecta]